jgi:ketosteroid isomerase-like protein
VLFVRVENGKLAFIREYFDPVRAALALDAPIVGLAH